MRTSRVVVGAATVALLGLTSSAVASPAHRAAATSGHLAVTGYALGGTSKAVIVASRKGLSTVTVDGVSINATGSGVEKPYAGLASVRRIAHQQGLRTELLVSNYSDRIGDFDPHAAHGLLNSGARITRLAHAMAGYVAHGHYDGVNIDLELVQQRDAGGLVRLAKALQAAMPKKRTVSIDISASTSLSEYRSQGYALKQLGHAVDVVQLMAYDEHGPGWSGPGPIGDLRWQQSSLATLLTQVPARKVDLGQAGYGYTWPVSGTGTTVTDGGARALVRDDDATAVWHADSGEWSATLSDGTRLWWADARSYALRTSVARQHHLHGLAVWVLGSADPLT
ncbi:MAG TPA: glycosyl hydrolase family 18 protein [Marmoricola sp.]|nr:glycosyl hydrolase family 18 protein [Marmoricola sp.]